MQETEFKLLAELIILDGHQDTKMSLLLFSIIYWYSMIDVF